MSIRVSTLLTGALMGGLMILGSFAQACDSCTGSPKSAVTAADTDPVATLESRAAGGIRTGAVAGA